MRKWGEGEEVGGGWVGANAIKEYALKADWEKKKIPCSTRESSRRQQQAELTFHLLSSDTQFSSKH